MMSFIVSATGSGHNLVVERRGNSPCHSAGSRELRLRDLLQRLAARFDADPEQCE